MTTLYGIKNCDTVKKARKWLEAQSVAYQFHDVRDDGLEAEKVQQWLDAVGWETLLNKRSTTWKQLDDSDKQDLDTERAKALLLANPTLIKRPVLEHNDQVQVGFKEALYAPLF